MTTLSERDIMLRCPFVESDPRIEYIDPNVQNITMRVVTRGELLDELSELQQQLRKKVGKQCPRFKIEQDPITFKYMIFERSGISVTRTGIQEMLLHGVAGNIAEDIHELRCNIREAQTELERAPSELLYLLQWREILKEGNFMKKSVAEESLRIYSSNQDKSGTSYYTFPPLQEV